MTSQYLTVSCIPTKDMYLTLLARDRDRETGIETGMEGQRQGGTGTGRDRDREGQGH